MSREAMKLALEALKQIDEAMPFPVAKLAQAALREALAEQPARPYRLLQDNGSKYFGESWDKAEQPAQQEPVAWMDGYRNIYSLEEKAAGCPEATIALVPMANHKKTSGSPIKELNCICGAVWEGDELVHLPRPPAQRKPLTDDPLQGAVDWLLEADGEYFCTATVQRTLRIGYNRAKRLCDTAKERAAHGVKEKNT